MTGIRLYETIAPLECSKMKAKILELSKMTLFKVDSRIKETKFHPPGIPVLVSFIRHLYAKDGE